MHQGVTPPKARLGAMEEGLLRRGEVRLGRRGWEPVRRGVMKAAASEVDGLCQVACIRQRGEQPVVVGLPTRHRTVGPPHLHTCLSDDDRQGHGLMIRLAPASPHGSWTVDLLTSRVAYAPITA